MQGFNLVGFAPRIFTLHVGRIEHFFVVTSKYRQEPDYYGYAACA